ncbi:MAG: DASS family sodium-coupled anion symporter [Bdellovibrionales bacterium]|jgi:solute carrier family 13 (sodium-dependent dicarboxylate transporter), member 2/3/5|nr:DASS family sodium-coupled anion symporter [Bdellovibrionales bacterium]MBT3524774.1 DASS family sodium-coupled anion symporter [Bdellovibrionales bacterium]MBT7670160.1 DASS family sodium-coupled anion symporter [Bdellovibrionales bacterium]
MESVVKTDDPLDISNFSLESLPKRELTSTEKWMKYLGFGLGIGVFLTIYYLPTPASLTISGQTVLALFALALIWWVTEPFPTYLTSLIVMVLLVLLDGWDEKHVMGVFGYDVIWLNLTSFVLSAGLISSGVAKRAALYMIGRFGDTAWGVLASFMIMHTILAAMIPSPVARVAMLLPLMMMSATIYGSTRDKPNNFAKILFLQNIHGVNGATTAFLTGANAHILAIVMITSMIGEQVYYSDWLFASFPVAFLGLLISWYIGPHLFKLRPEERLPQLSGGVKRVKEELDKLGPIQSKEKRALTIFLVVIVLWATDRLHLPLLGYEISASLTALIGAILMLLPKIGIIDWAKTNIPWHLLLFSAGAYACGFALTETRAAQWAVGELFDLVGLRPGLNFWIVYSAVIALNMFSHLFFTSKTMRTMIFIPFVITMAQKLGYNPLSLALPAAFTISWVVGLPISGKPNVLLFGTGQFSSIDCARYGILMTLIATILLIIAGFTWFAFLGITPAFWQ